MIDVESVEFSYPAGVQALAGVSLQVGRGEGLALMGENGAGKSTLAKHLNGLLKPDAGTVTIDGRATTDRQPSDLARQIGYVFQNPDDQLFAQTVRQEVEFGPRNLGFDEDVVDQRVEMALSAVGLGGVSDQHPYDLHPTDRKLVAVACVLAMQTQVVILDEPTTGQDFAALNLLGEVIRSLLEGGITVIAISHDVDFCAQYFRRVVLMANGLILADGQAEDVFTMEAELERAAVERPQIARLTASLGWKSPAMNSDEFVRRLAERQKEG